MDKTTLMRRLIAVLMPALSCLPLKAQQQADTVYLFRFVPRKDMLYIPYRDNGPEMEQLCRDIQSHNQQLKEGKMYISVSSYAASGNRQTPSRRMAYLRNSRIKSELITRTGITEGMFVTDKLISSAYGPDSLRNVVVVTFPASVQKVKEIAGTKAAEKVQAYIYEVQGKTEAERLAAEKAQRERLAKEKAEAERIEAERRARQEREREQAAPPQAVEETAQPLTVSEDGNYTLSLHANLLRWATLTPDLGIEWRINKDWSIRVNGAWTSWGWDNKDRRYALWEVSPEIRYYTGKKKRGYLGAMYHTGEFNYKLSETGRQGDLTGGGLTGGYRLEMNRSLSLDFSIGVGCTHAGYEKYAVIDGVRVKQGKQNKNYWGVNHAGIILVWKLK